MQNNVTMSGIEPEEHDEFFVECLTNACLDIEPKPDREYGIWRNTSQLDLSTVYKLHNQLKQEKAVRIYRSLMPFKQGCLSVDAFVDFSKFLVKNLKHKSPSILIELQDEVNVQREVIESDTLDQSQKVGAWISLWELLVIRIPDREHFISGVTMYQQFDDLYEKIKATSPIFNPSLSLRKKRKPAKKEPTSARNEGSLGPWIR